MSNLTVSDRGTVRVITIDRPQRRNAVDSATAVELAAAFRDFDSDDRVSVAVLTGASGVSAPDRGATAGLARWRTRASASGGVN